MRPDFQTDVFWASSIRSKLGGNLSAVAISRQNLFFEWAPLILYEGHPFCMVTTHNPATYLLLLKTQLRIRTVWVWDSAGIPYVLKSDETF